MNVNLAVSVRDRPARLVPMQDAERPTIRRHSLFQLAVRKLLRDRLHTPMIRMKRNLVGREVATEEGRFWQTAYGVLYCLKGLKDAQRKGEAELCVRVLIKANDEDPLTCLWNAKVLRVKLSFENRETCLAKQVLEIREQLLVILVT